MATKTQYLTFFIVLPDEAAVRAYQALYPVGVNRAPYDAATAGGASIEFGAPWVGATAPPGPAPYSWSAFAALGIYSDVPFPINVATFTRHTGGFLGIGGTTTRFYWIGQFVYLGNNGAAPTTALDAPVLEYAPLAKRRHLDGFDAPLNGSFPNSGTNGLTNTKDAAQWTGGMGLAFRGANGNSGTSPAFSTWTPGLVDPGSWVRMYVRLRSFPDVTVAFYRAHGAPSGQAGVTFEITPSGQIAVYSVSNTAVKTLLGTVATSLPVWTGLPDHDAWMRIDALILYNQDAGSPSSGKVRFYLNNLFQNEFVASDGLGGLGQNSSRHAYDVIGQDFTVANTLELDIDHFINAAVPTGREWNGIAHTKEWSALTNYIIGDVAFNSTEDHVYKCILANGPAGVGTKKPTLRTNGTYWHRYEGKDWLNGSKIVLARPRAFGAAHNALWGGANADFRQLAQNGWGGGTPGSTLSVSTSGAICEVDTDVALVCDLDKQTIATGAVAAMVSSLDSQGTLAGSLGYTVGGVTSTRVELGAAGIVIAQQALLSPDGVATGLVDISPLLLRYVKGADATAATIKSLVAQVELCGVFSKADWMPSPTPAVWEATISYGLADTVSYLGVLYKSLTAANVGATPSTSPTAWLALTPPVFPVSRGPHNYPYPRSPWGQDALAAPPSAAFICHTGTYVGNNTGQDLLFRLPVHAFFVRPLTGGTGGFVPWFSAGINGHFTGQQRLYPNIAFAEEDTTFAPGLGQDIQQQRYRVRLSGQDTQLNAVGVTYQYLAVCDPGGRFLLTGSFTHAQGSVAVDNKLVDPGFTPDFVMLQGESYDNTANNRFYGKGPQNAVNSISAWAPAVVNTALSIAAGVLRSQATLHLQNLSEYAYAAWRKADGNNDPNQNSVMATGGYVGDGAASRSFTLPTTGKRPLWMLIWAESGNSLWRDPSHTTNTSSDDGGTIVATGITAGGIDSVTVGLAANAGGVNYNYILFWASATAGNGGWGVNGEYIPVEAAAGPGDGGMWGADPSEAAVLASLPGVGGGTGIALVGEPDLDTTTVWGSNTINIGGLLGGQVCEVYTRRSVNIALQRLGISEQIVNLSTDLTEAAYQARMIVLEDINTVLRDYPWPFATRYADLVLVGGTATTPVNKDWQYSYRIPSAVMYARRLVSQNDKRRAYDPTPIPFRVGGDDTGPLLFTDAVLTVASASVAAVPVQLEYTIRANCPSFFGDARFRNALQWRFAHSLAGPLARDKTKQAYCYAMYQEAILDAQIDVANESQQEKAGEADWITGR